MVLRVLHLLCSVDPRSGGPAEVVKQLAAECDEAGIATSHILTLDRPDEDFLRNFPVSYSAIGISRSGIGSSLLNHYGYTPYLAKWLRDNSKKFDVCIVHGLWNYAAEGSFRSLHSSSLKYFVFIHGMLDPWFRKARVKSFLKQLFWTFFDGPLLAGSCGAIFTCDEERMLSHRAFRGYNKYRKLVFRLGIRDVPPAGHHDIEQFRALLPGLGQKRYLLFLSRIHQKKGIDLLIEAFGKLAAFYPDWDLIIAGPDDSGLKKKLVARCSELNILSRVHWPGMLSGSAKWGALHGAEGFILPSHQENFGVAVAEAMACSKPVFITKRVNIWREIVDARAGIAQEDDISGVGLLVEECLKMDDTRRAELGNASRKCFEKFFNSAHFAKSFAHLVRDGQGNGE